MEERVGGAVLRGAVPRDAAQLHAVGGLRPPVRAPAQHPGPDHQRLRAGHRARLRAPLPHLLPGVDQAPRDVHPAGRGRVRRHPRHPRHRLRPHLASQVARRRDLLRLLRDHDVRCSLVSHEAGDPNEKRGVHAPLPFSRFLLQWPMLDHLRAYQIRSLHYYPQRAGSALLGGSAGTSRNVLQVHQGAVGSSQEEGRDRARGGGRDRRCQQARQCPQDWPLMIELARPGLMRALLIWRVLSRRVIYVMISIGVASLIVL
ncbi:bidirectional sugar transporter SWEET4-like [Iris pallida]|uniref:Bidirectional sugar transporter SWEET4-like n=1 Tax=Iris pallida TaxID=29817 RepID=A0AAX6GJR2_IRIPA|nr:bidirectional sugar transporter SWEET4-like [Iris pallida]